MSEWESRLYRRIEELVASSDDYYDDQSRDDLLGLERALANTRGEVSAIRADLAALRDAVTVLVGKATDDSESAIAGLRRQVDSVTAREMADLRGDLADALEEVRDRISTQVASQASDLLDRLDEGNAVVTRRVTELSGPVTAVAASTTDTEERLSHLEELATGIQRELSAVSSEWSSRTTAVVEQARTAGEAAAAAVEESSQNAAAEFEERVTELLSESRSEIAAVLAEA